MAIKLWISSMGNKLFPYRIILFTILIITIFHQIFLKILDKYIIPIVSQISNNNLIVAVCTLLISIFVCVLYYKQLYKAKYPISHTMLIEISSIGIYVILKYHFGYIFYEYFNIEYFWFILSPFLVVEIWRMIKIIPRSSANDNSLNCSFITDSPCDDESFVKERGVYADHLIQHIFGTFNSYKDEDYKFNPFIKNGAFVINISEEYGYGKTSFFALLHKKLIENKNNQYISFRYQPWLCESENAMVTELFNRFREELSPYAPQINRNIANYIRTLLDKSGNIFINSIKTLFCQSPSMHEEREKLKETIVEIDKPVIVFIDDVDRLQKEVLLALLNLVRDTADFQNVFYIIAADKDHLTKCLEDCGISNPDKYLKKIINYEFMLPANDGVIMTILQEKLISALNKYIKEKEELNRVVSSIVNHENIESVFSNVRDIKRILNDYILTLAIIKSGLEKEIDYKDLFLLTIIKSFRPDVYKSLRDNEEQLLCLDNEIYILKTKYADVHNEKLVDFIKTIAENTGNNDIVKEKKCNTINEMMNDSRISSDEFVAHSLRYLFSSQRNLGDDINIKHKESYYKYFSGQLRKNQLSNLEVEQILRYDEGKFQEQMKTIFNNHKTDSFITRMLEWSKKWRNSPILFVRKVHLFIKEDFPIEFEKTPYGLDKRDYKDNVYYVKRLKYSPMLYHLYCKNPIKKVDDNEKELLHNFILENDHYEFSARTLSILLGQYPNHLIIEYNELASWHRELIKQFIENRIKNNQEPFKDEILDVIHVLRDGSFNSKCWNKEFADYLSSTSDYWTWFERLVIYENGIFTKNNKYIKQLDFFVAGNFENLINNCAEEIQQDERVKDLMSLIHMVDLHMEHIEVHPALLYIKNKYNPN